MIDGIPHQVDERRLHLFQDALVELHFASLNDQVHVLAQGRIIKSGGKDLALRLEDEGYGPILREAGLSPDAPDEALLVPQAPAGAEPEPVEAAR